MEIIKLAESAYYMCVYVYRQLTARARRAPMSLLMQASVKELFA